MFKNYVLVAIRNFRRNKIFSFINIVGLSIGISAAMVIFLIVHYDLSFDKFHKDPDRIYRIVTEGKSDGYTSHVRGVPGGLVEAVAHETTGVDYTVPILTLDEQRVSVPKRGAEPVLFRRQSDLVFAGQAYFSVFQYHWLAGSSSSLGEPYRVVLTLERARTYFPGLSPDAMLGRTITYFDSIPTTVSGVVDDLKENTDFVFTDFISFPTLTGSKSLRNAYFYDWNGISSSMQLFVKLSKGATATALQAQLSKIQAKYDPQAPVNTKSKKDYRSFSLEPLSELHLNDTYGSFDDVRQAHPSTLYGLSILAAILLLLACINFINLTTARSVQRAREIGIRKTIGSSRRQLVIQFIGETFLTTLMATVVSILIVPLLLAVFSNFIPHGIHLDLIGQPAVILFLVLLVIGVSILSGFYPAAVLSRYRPVQVLRPSASAAGGVNTRSAVLRKTLTVVQFFIAQAFVIATLVVARQIHFMLTTDPGFRQHAVVYFPIPDQDTSLTKKFAFVNELRSYPGIQAVSLGGSPPMAGGWNGQSLTYDGGRAPVTQTVEFKLGGTGFLSLYQIPLVAGRAPFASDTIRECAINESYARLLGFRDPHQAINKLLYTYNRSPLPIVGVVKDFHTHSLQQEIQPLVFTTADRYCSVIHVALPLNDRDGSWASTLQAVAAAYKKFYPGAEFIYRFLDQNIANFYENEQHVASLLRWATAVAILISCLGLLGLVVYTTSLRLKEIGVRKVLGASVTQIVALLSKDFMSLIGIAFLLATPLAWWATHQWLQNFAYRPGFGWWVIMLAGLGMAVIGGLTLGFQTIRAARANPVESLRTD